MPVTPFGAKIIGIAEEWDDVAFNVIEVLDGWRGAPVNRLRECRPRKLPGNFDIMTKDLCEWCHANLEKPKTTPLKEICAALMLWEDTRDFSGLPSRSALQAKLISARILVREIIAVILKPSPSPADQHAAAIEYIRNCAAPPKARAIATAVNVHYATMRRWLAKGGPLYQYGVRQKRGIGYYIAN